MGHAARPRRAGLPSLRRDPVAAGRPDEDGHRGVGRQSSTTGLDHVDHGAARSHEERLYLSQQAMSNEPASAHHAPIAPERCRTPIGGRDWSDYR